MNKNVIALSACIIALSACSARVSGPAVEVEPAVVAVEVASAEGSDRIWVCHRGRWQEVATPAAQGHARHGDRVSEAPREARGSC